MCLPTQSRVCVCVCVGWHFAIKPNTFHWGLSCRAIIYTVSHYISTIPTCSISEVISFADEKSSAAETGGVFTGDCKSPLDTRPSSVTLKPPPNEAILQMKGERTPRPTVASVRIQHPPTRGYSLSLHFGRANVKDKWGTMLKSYACFYRADIF